MNNKVATQEKQTLDVFHQEHNLQRFQELLGDRTLHYLASVSVVMQSNKKLQQCSSESLISAVLQGASLDLSFDPSLAEAYILPFKGEAKFLPGYKGLIQLALRTGQFVELDAKIVTNRMFRELRDQLAQSDDPHSTIIRFFSSIDFYPELHGGQIYGYVAYFRLKNGFSRVVYWDKERCVTHAKRFSPTYDGKNNRFYNNSAWITAEDAMCLKTVIRQVLNYAPKSKEIKGMIEAENIYTVQIQEGSQTALPTHIPKREGHEDEDLFGAEPPSHKIIIQRCDANAQRLKGTKYGEGVKKYWKDKEEGFTGTSIHQWDDWMTERIQFVVANGGKKSEEIPPQTEKAKALIQEIIHQWDEQDYHQEHRWNSLKKKFELNGLKQRFHSPEEALAAFNETDWSLYLDHLLEKTEELEKVEKKEK